MKKGCMFTLLALAASFSTADSQPLTDHRGEAVVVSAAPERVAALAIFAADVLEALGQAPVGMVTYEGRFPLYLNIPDSTTDYGDMTAPNLELMAQDTPDLTIGMVNYAGPFAREIERLSPFVATNDLTLADSMSGIEIVTQALGLPEQGKQMNQDFQQLLESYKAKATGDVSALFVWSYYDTLFAYHDLLLPSEFLPMLGAENPLGQFQGADPLQAFKPIEAEDLLALDPDVLLMFVSHGDTAKSSPALARLRAYQQGRAYYVGDHYSQPVGPIARELVLRELAHLLYPETFAAPDLPDTVKARTMNAQ